MAPSVSELLKVPYVLSYDVNSEKQFVYSWNKTGQWQVYLFDGQRSKKITSGRQSKLSPKFCGSSILFVSDYNGDERFDVYESDTRGVRNITPNTDYSILPELSVTKDGEKVGFVSNRSGDFAANILLRRSLEQIRVSNHKLSDTSVLLSPDGRLAAVTSLVKAQDFDIFLYDVASRPEQLSSLQNEKRIEAYASDWAPDSRMIAFVSSSKGYSDVGLWKVGDEIIWITNSDTEYYSPVFSQDGSKIAFLVNTGADIKLAIHDLKRSEIETIDELKGVADSPKFVDDHTVSFLHSSSKSPQDLWLFDCKDHSLKQVTKSIPKNIDTRNFVDSELVHYKNPRDNMIVPALLYRPISRAKKLAIIDIHGGPSAQALNSWNPLVQIFVDHGFLVLRPNYRGSTGFGKKFMEANRFVMGDLDLDDCVAARDFLLNKKMAEKVAVYGASFGGYLTMCALTKYPDHWACGASLVPFLNWFTEIENEREDLRYWDLQNMGDPSKDAERLRNASPIFFIDRIAAPVLLIAGANDPRCPLEEAEQAKDTLLKLRKKVEFRFYQDEGHGFRKMKNRIDAYTKVVGFIRKYLKA